MTDQECADALRVVCTRYNQVVTRIGQELKTLHSDIRAAVKSAEAAGLTVNLHPGLQDWLPIDELRHGVMPQLDVKVSRKTFV